MQTFTTVDEITGVSASRSIVSARRHGGYAFVVVETDWMGEDWHERERCAYVIRPSKDGPVYRSAGQQGFMQGHEWQKVRDPGRFGPGMVGLTPEWVERWALCEEVEAT